MADVLLYSAHITLISLIALVSYRIRALSLKYYPHENPAFKSSINSYDDTEVCIKDDYQIKMECLKQAQIFSGIQMLDIKRSYGDISQQNLAWLSEAISLYLIGAVDLIGKQARCGTSTRKELITLVLKSNLNLSDDVSGQYFSDALYRTYSSENDLMVRAGARAAKLWMAENSVPKALSLNTQLNEWGVFA